MGLQICNWKWNCKNSLGKGISKVSLCVFHLMSFMALNQVTWNWPNQFNGIVHCDTEEEWETKFQLSILQATIHGAPRDNSSIWSQSYCNSLQEMWNLVDPSDSDSKQNKMLQSWCLSSSLGLWACPKNRHKLGFMAEDSEWHCSL